MGKIYAPEKSYWVLSKNLEFFGVTFREILSVEISKKSTESAKNTEIMYKGWDLATGSSELNNQKHFLKEDLSDTLEYFSQTDWFFAISRKYKKRVIFYITMVISPGVDMITRQMTPFFHLYFELYPLV